jgi:hypothetical protein
MTRQAGSSSLKFILVIALAFLLPRAALAQRGFVGVGTGFSRIRPEYSALEVATRPSVLVRVGIGGGWLKLVLDWQAHGLADEEPRPGDYQGGVTTRVPRVLRTDFLLLGAQLQVGDFYVRPAVGWSGQSFAAYLAPNGNDAISAETSSEGGPAVSLSTGYRFKLADRISLALELSALRSNGEDSSSPCSVLALQVIPLLDF